MIEKPKSPWSNVPAEILQKEENERYKRAFFTDFTDQIKKSANSHDITYTFENDEMSLLIAPETGDFSLLKNSVATLANTANDLLMQQDRGFTITVSEEGDELMISLTTP